MNIQAIKRKINHQEIVGGGYRLKKITKGFFKKNGMLLTTPVLEYRKNRFVGNVDVGYYIKYYNRFGFINTAKI